MYICIFDLFLDFCVICGNYVLIIVKVICIINNVIFIFRMILCILNVYFKVIYFRYNFVKMILDML